MQPLFIQRGPGRSEVEVRRCPRCFGLWFDAGALERALSRPVQEERLEGHTPRRCPACTLTMETVLLPQAIPAETCATCRGVWLDAGELKELGGREPALPQNRSLENPWRGTPRGSPAGGFDCAKCGKRTPFTDAHGTARGLVCGACTPEIQQAPPGPILELPDNSTSLGNAVVRPPYHPLFNLYEVIQYLFFWKRPRQSPP